MYLILAKNIVNKMQSTDNETGEVTLISPFEPMDIYDIDMETGEFDITLSTLPIRKTTFVIPKELIQQRRTERNKLCCMDTHDNYTLSKKEEVISLQEVSYQKFDSHCEFHCLVCVFRHFNYYFLKNFIFLFSFVENRLHFNKN